MVRVICLLSLLLRLIEQKSIVFWPRLFILLFFFPLLLGGNRKGENDQSRCQKSCLSARSLNLFSSSFLDSKTCKKNKDVKSNNLSYCKVRGAINKYSILSLQNWKINNLIEYQKYFRIDRYVNTCIEK